MENACLIFQRLLQDLEFTEFALGALIPEADQPSFMSLVETMRLEGRFTRTGSTVIFDPLVPTTEQPGVTSTEIAMYFNHFGTAFSTRFNLTDSLDDLDYAIFLSEQSVALTPDDHPDRVDHVRNLSAAFLARFDRMGSLDDLDSSIAMNERAIALTPDDRPATRAGLLNDLGDALQRRFGQTRSIEDLRRAITFQEDAVATIPKDHPDLAWCFKCLGIALQSRFEWTGSMDDLDDAIAAKEKAMALTPDNHPDSVAYLDSLGNSLKNRFDHTGSMDDINRAVTMQQHAVELTPKDNTDLPMILNNLSVILHARFDRTVSKDDLEHAIIAGEEAMASIPLNHPFRASVQSNLGNLFKSRFMQTGSRDDLDTAITMQDEAVARAAAASNPNLANQLNNLGTALQSRFEQTGSMDDLERAISTQEQAVASTLPNDPKLSRHLGNLGSSFLSKFECTGSMDSLGDAIAMMQQALELMPKEHPERLGQLSHLSTALKRRSEQTGSLDDFNHAITIREQVVASVPQNHPDFAMYLNNLSNDLQTRFEWEGSMNDLDRAISMSEQAVALTPNHHYCLAMYLDNLSNALRSRFLHTGSTEDLNHAIEISEQAVKSTPNDHPDLARHTNSLANALLSRFERTESIDDLKQAITTSKQAVASTQDGHPDFPRHLSSLGTTLQSLYKWTTSVDDLNNAIEIKKRAAQLTPSEHPEFPGRLNNLAIALKSRFDHNGSPEDLDNAVTTFEQVIAATPSNHPSLTVYLNNFGNVLQCRFEHTGSMDDFGRAIAIKEQAIGILTGRPSIRIEVADSASQMLIGHDLHRAKPLLQTAIELLPIVSPRTLTQRDCQLRLSHFGGLASRAVSVSLECGETPYDALRLLELGRGVIASLQLDVRWDISALKQYYPDLAQQLDDVRNRLDRQVYNNVEPTQNDLIYIASRHRRDLSKRFDSILDVIRQLEGFERLFRGPLESELKEIAGCGSIVLLNASEIRSDAFLINKNNIRSIRLPLLQQDLEAYAQRFLNAIRGVRGKTYSHAVQEMNSVLEWLWDVAVEPVLTELGFTQTPSDGNWPRLWWVGCGLLNILPLHAAGYHNSFPRRTALDRVISSYTPTVKALAYAWERSTKVESIQDQKCLVIGMPKTPEQKDLPHSAKEIEELQKLIPSIAQIKIIQLPTKADVLSSLPHHQIIHLCCHGHASAHDPSKSKLFLNDWKTAPLTVSDLMSLNIQSSQFAYLSACQTSRTKDLSLLDESINLSSAVQLAGYPSVVGTLWQINDESSVEVAKDVYSWMLQGGEKFNTRLSAEGLHRAVRNLRDKTCSIPGFSRKVSSDPLVWGPYIHLGV